MFGYKRTVVVAECTRVCYTFVYLCVCARGLQFNFFVDAVISEDVAVHVSTLWDKNMFKDSATAACHLFYHH